MDSPPPKLKVFAYITHGTRLLVFSHPESPEAGIQVPAGSVEPGEDLVAAALREAHEETGLADLTLVGYLGDQLFARQVPGVVGIHHRHFYHLRVKGDPPQTWRHYEYHPSDGSPGPIPFDFFWVSLPDGVPALIADHGYYLPELCAALGLR